MHQKFVQYYLCYAIFRVFNNGKTEYTTTFYPPFTKHGKQIRADSIEELKKKIDLDWESRTKHLDTF